MTSNGSTVLNGKALNAWKPATETQSHGDSLVKKHAQKLALPSEKLRVSVSP